MAKFDPQPTLNPLNRASHLVGFPTFL